MMVSSTAGTPDMMNPMRRAVRIFSTSKSVRSGTLSLRCHNRLVQTSPKVSSFVFFLQLIVV